MVISQKKIIRYILRYIKKPSLFGIAVVLGFLAYQIYGCDLNSRPYASYNVRVVDGDTLVLDSKLRIRLQGMDAPETKQQCADIVNSEKKYFECGKVATMRLAQIIGKNKVECTNEGTRNFSLLRYFCQFVIIKPCTGPIMEICIAETPGI